LNIIDVNSIQQDYIIDSKEIEMFAVISRSLLSIIELLFNREAKEEERERRSA
jgi:hypothetical protein